MAKKTLLEIVQIILSGMDSDEVNSISDTVESLQVAYVVRDAYETLVAPLNLPERTRLMHLESVSRTSSPNYLRVPAGIKSLSWLRYNGKEIGYLDKEVFFDRIFKGIAEATFTTSDPDDSISYLIRSDKDPEWFTSVDDTLLVLDSFNQSVDTTLQQTKSMAFVQLNPVFTLTDDFVPDIDENFFPVLIAEAKAAAFVDLKQVSNSKAETNARRGLVRIQNELSKTARSPLDRLPNYSRRR